MNPSHWEFCWKVPRKYKQMAVPRLNLLLLRCLIMINYLILNLIQ